MEYGPLTFYLIRTACYCVASCRTESQWERCPICIRDRVKTNKLFCAVNIFIHPTGSGMCTVESVVTRVVVVSHFLAYIKKDTEEGQITRNLNV